MLFRSKVEARNFDIRKHLLEYDAAAAIELISPTPLLVIAAEQDSLISLPLVREACPLGLAQLATTTTDATVLSILPEPLKKRRCRVGGRRYCGQFAAKPTF